MFRLIRGAHVARSVASELQDLSGEVLHHRCEVHGRARTDAVRILALLQEPCDTAHGELESGLGGPAHSLLARLTLAATRHCEIGFLRLDNPTNVY
jgi:hypothetical protein